MSIFDVHCHVISTDEKRYPRGAIGGRQSDWSQKRPVSIEQMIAAMDTAGVARSVLVQASTCYGHDNSYVAEALRTHPDRFTGVFSADVLAPDAREKMKHWMSKGFTGMRLFTTGSTMPDQADWLDDPRCFPAWELAQDSNLPVCLQMTAKAIPQLQILLKRFPRVRVALDHCARPQLEDGPPYKAAQGLWDLAANPNVFLKISPHNFVGVKKGLATADTFFAKLIAEFGAKRIAWGSNFPTHEGSLSELLQLGRDSLKVASAEDQKWIFGGTTQILYPALKGA